MHRPSPFRMAWSQRTVFDMCGHLDKVLHDAVDAGARMCAIFKEPTITPSAEQKEKFGLKKTWGSPNGAMRRGWNGITISRDTIHIKGMELGFKQPVIFERQAVGGEYQAGACFAHLS
jgi:isocitrate dehydrogenase